MKRIICSLLVLVGAVFTVAAQQQATAGVDSSITALDSRVEVYIKENIPFKSPIPYAPVREADVTAEWILWRKVELREKRNLPLYYPIAPTRKIGSRVNFFTLLLEGVERGEITAYDPHPISDEFDSNQIRTFEQITSNSLLKFEDRQEPSVSIYTGADTMVTVEGKDILRDYDCTRLIVKEKWYFDKRHSRLDYRVIGICPVFVFTLQTESGDERQYTVPVMWIYMPEARPLLARHPVYNDFNDAQNISFDDFFMQKFYDGLIERESNVYNNRYIYEYQRGLDVLHEARRIEMEIFNWEQDAWEY